MGRKPLGDQPLTDTEKKRRWRDKKGLTLQARYDSLLRKYEHQQREFAGYREAHEKVNHNLIMARYEAEAERDAALRELEKLREMMRSAVVVPFPKKG